MDRTYGDYLPGIVSGLREFIEIGKAVNPEWELVWAEIEKAMQDQFIESLTENGCSRWEKILKTKVKETNILEDRRFRILAKVNKQLPYSWRSFKKQLENLCGKDGYKVETRPEYTLFVRVALTAKENYTDVVQLVDEVVPANLIIDISLLYNQHSTLAKFTHGQLNKWMHREIREEVLV